MDSRVPKLAFCSLLLMFDMVSQAFAHVPRSSGLSPGITERSNITSRHTGISYNLYIYLPPGYERNRYSFPIIYAMDGDYRYGKLVNVLEQNAIDAIFIGVSCVSAERRRVDYAMPGAQKYYLFLTRELIPFIEKKYRVNAKQRLLSGHSLSGQFVLYALFMEDPENRYFSSFMSSDGSFWHQPSILTSMEQQMHRKTRRLPANLVMSGAGNFHYVTSMYNDIKRRGYDGLQVKFLNYSGWDHVEMDAPSFRDSVRFLFGKTG